MAINPVGFVPVFDFGNARIITAYARDAISGGQLVLVSGASGAVSSGTNSFVSSDIQVATGGSGLNVGGVAINNVASGGQVGIMTRGMVILVAGGTVTGGFDQEAINDIGVQDGTSGTKLVGRAWSTAASGGYCLVDLNI